jgi:dinuclear metal center YbgI/SA1388 family protein
MVTVSDITSFLFSWAPKALAWEKDNIGLIVGDPSRQVTSVLVTLDVTDAVLDEALSLGANVVVAHHPPIFLPLKTIRENVPAEAMLMKAIRHGISLIAMHTNADAAGSGLNAALAARLGLVDVRPLDGLDGLIRRVIVRLRCDDDGKAGIRAFLLEHEHLHGMIRDERDGLLTVEVDIDEWAIATVLSAFSAMRGTQVLDHSTMRMTAGSSEHGIGAVGRLPAPVPALDFARQVRDVLSASQVRVSAADPGRTIRVAAVCGGSGSSFIRQAIAAGADAFVTADLKYHDFTDHGHALLLVDAGHFETEGPFVQLCASILSGMHFPDTEKISIFTTSMAANPIRFV